MAELGHGEPGKMALERPPQVELVRGRCGAARSGRALIPAATNLQLRRTRLAQALHHQPQAAIAEFGIHYSPHHVSLRGPEMQKALVVLARDAVLRIGKIKHPAAIFQHDRLPGPPRNSSNCRLNGSGVMGDFPANPDGRL